MVRGIVVLHVVSSGQSYMYVINSQVNVVLLGVIKSLWELHVIVQILQSDGVSF